VTPTVEKCRVSGWETVSAGTPGISSPELATASESSAGSTGAGSAGPGGSAGTSASGPASTTSPSEVTTAVSSGCWTDPRSTASMDGATGAASGTGAA
jgi:hypothetical protein